MAADFSPDKLGELLKDPAMMEKVRAVASMLQSKGGGAAPEPLPTEAQSAPQDTAPFAEAIAPTVSEAAPETLSLPSLTASGLFAPQDLALLKALKPYLGQEKQQKLDRVMQIVRMAQLAENLKGFL